MDHCRCYQRCSNTERVVRACKVCAKKVRAKEVCAKYMHAKEMHTKELHAEEVSAKTVKTTCFNANNQEIRGLLTCENNVQCHDIDVTGGNLLVELVMDDPTVKADLFLFKEGTDPKCDNPYDNDGALKSSVEIDSQFYFTNGSNSEVRYAYPDRDDLQQDYDFTNLSQPVYSTSVDPCTGWVYGADKPNPGDSEKKFVRFKPQQQFPVNLAETPTVELVGDGITRFEGAPVILDAYAATSAGVLYGYSNTTESLYIVNKTDGSLTLVGSPGPQDFPVVSMAFDWSDNDQLYAISLVTVFAPSITNVYTVDKNDGSFTNKFDTIIPFGFTTSYGISFNYPDGTSASGGLAISFNFFGALLVVLSVDKNSVGVVDLSFLPLIYFSDNMGLLEGSGITTGRVIVGDSDSDVFECELEDGTYTVKVALRGDSADPELEEAGYVLENEGTFEFKGAINAHSLVLRDEVCGTVDASKLKVLNGDVLKLKAQSDVKAGDYLVLVPNRTEPSLPVEVFSTEGEALSVFMGDRSTLTVESGDLPEVLFTAYDLGRSLITGSSVNEFKFRSESTGSELVLPGPSGNTLLNGWVISYDERNGQALFGHNVDYEADLIGLDIGAITDIQYKVIYAGWQPDGSLYTVTNIKYKADGNDRYAVAVEKRTNSLFPGQVQLATALTEGSAVVAEGVNIGNTFMNVVGFFVNDITTGRYSQVGPANRAVGFGTNYDTSLLSTELRTYTDTGNGTFVDMWGNTQTGARAVDIEFLGVVPNMTMTIGEASGTLTILSGVYSTSGTSALTYQVTLDLDPDNNCPFVTSFARNNVIPQFLIGGEPASIANSKLLIGDPRTNTLSFPIAVPVTIPNYNENVQFDKNTYKFGNTSLDALDSANLVLVTIDTSGDVNLKVVPQGYVNLDKDNTIRYVSNSAEKVLTRGASPVWLVGAEEYSDGVQGAVTGFPGPCPDPGTGPVYPPNDIDGYAPYNTVSPGQRLGKIGQAFDPLIGFQQFSNMYYDGAIQHADWTLTNFYEQSGASPNPPPGLIRGSTTRWLVLCNCAAWCGPCTESCTNAGEEISAFSQVSFGCCLLQLKNSQPPSAPQDIIDYAAQVGFDVPGKTGAFVVADPFNNPDIQEAIVGQFNMDGAIPNCFIVDACNMQVRANVLGSRSRGEWANIFSQLQQYTVDGTIPSFFPGEDPGPNIFPVDYLFARNSQVTGFNRNRAVAGLAAWSNGQGGVNRVLEFNGILYVQDLQAYPLVTLPYYALALEDAGAGDLVKVSMGPYSITNGYKNLSPGKVYGADSFFTVFPFADTSARGDSSFGAGALGVAISTTELLRTYGDIGMEY